MASGIHLLEEEAAQRIFANTQEKLAANREGNGDYVQEVIRVVVSELQRDGVEATPYEDRRWRLALRPSFPAPVKYLLMRQRIFCLMIF